MIIFVVPYNFIKKLHLLYFITSRMQNNGNYFHTGTCFCCFSVVHIKICIYSLTYYEQIISRCDIFHTEL